MSFGDQVRQSRRVGESSGFLLRIEVLQFLRLNGEYSCESVIWCFNKEQKTFKATYTKVYASISYLYKRTFVKLW